MANTLEFRESIGGATRLALSYIENDTHIPLPSHTKVWAGNITADGADYIAGKYENIQITLALKVTGATASDLDTNLRALVAEITRENWLYFEPDGGTGIYYHTYPYDTAEAHALLVTALRSNLTVYPFMITLMAEPFGYTAEETIIVLQNLAPNWSMELPGLIEPIDFWVKGEGNANSHVSPDSDPGDYLWGETSVNLTDRNSYASLTSEDYITIDKTKHYCLSFDYYVEQGSLDCLDVRVFQYDAGNNLVGTITFAITAPALDTWYSYTDIIYPEGTGGGVPEWDTDCAKAKLCFRVQGDNAGDDEVYYVDGVIFACSEYLSGHVVSNPLGIVIPPQVVSGDVASPCDMYLEAFDGFVCSRAGMYIGGREAYSEDYVPYASASTGTAAYASEANQGDLRTLTITGNLVSGGGFETWAGGPPADPSGWTVTRSVNGVVQAAAGYVGSYSLQAYVTAWPAQTNTIISTDFMAVNVANDYTLEFWYRLLQGTGYNSGRLVAYVRCYDAVGGPTGTLTALDTTKQQTSWAWHTYSVASASWPAGTTKVKLEFQMTGGQGAFDPDYAYLDEVQLYQSSGSLSLVADLSVNDIRGHVLPFVHARKSAAQTGVTTSIQGQITDSIGFSVSSKELVGSESIVIPTTWAYIQAPEAFSLPTAWIPIEATSMIQRLDVTYSALTAGTFYLDDLSLIPIDNGFVQISAESNENLVVDCQSELACVLVSWAGIKNESAALPQGLVRQRLRVSPEGTNMALLVKTLDASNNQVGKCFINVSLRYYPRYLLVG